MGISNRTPDSFYDRGATWDFDAFVRRAEQLVTDGADLLDVGGVKAGPGPEVDEDEELDRVVPAVEALRARFDVPLSVDTWRASVLDAACAAGAVVGNDISGFGDPDYLRVAAKHDVTVVATHIRLRPACRRSRPALRRSRRRRHRVPARTGRAGRSRRPAPRADRARRRPRPRQDARRRARCCCARARSTPALGYPLLLSASNKRFIGELLGREIDDRRAESLAAVAYGAMHGCRIVRVHDVRGTARVCRTIEALL